MRRKSIEREIGRITVGPPPKATSEHVSKAMKGNKARDTKPELALRKSLWKKGIRGYRLHCKKVSGTPDICFNKRKVAIFVNGCFWHRCARCNIPFPQSNPDYWRRKLLRNVQRDLVKIKRLKGLGWDVLTVWECDVNDRINTIVDQIADIVVPEN